MTTETRTDPISTNATAPTEGVVALTHRDDGIAVLRLGSPDERLITLSEKRLRSLAATLDELEQGGKQPRGLIVTGPGPDMFAAGADVHEIADITDPAVGIDAARFGQSLFGRFANLPFPVIGAIEGPCLGGGLELALGFDVRVASDSKSTKLGLPEVKLGIVPGFGGTQRLTRLIGLPRALDLILNGKVLDAKRALKNGVVDRVVPAERLLVAATEEVERRLGANRKAPRRRLRGANRWLGKAPLRRFVASSVQRKLGRGQARFYDAPRRALELCLDALRLAPDQGFANEARALGELIVSPTSKGLVHLYFLTERSKRNGKSEHARDVNRGIVIGGGVMGAGIAGALATKGIRVRLCDVVLDSLAGAKARLQKALDKKLKRRRVPRHEAQAIQDRLAVSTEWGSLQHTDLFLEAVTEDLDLKRKLFRTAIERGLPESAILATNTSSLSIEAMAEDLPAPERVVGIHFFNPPEKMPLVEVVRGAQTSDAAVDTACRLATRLGKFPVVVGDRAGFLVNRCLAPYLDEAARLLIEGNSPEFVDQVMLDFGMPMGPARLLDEVGFDVAAKVSEVLAAAFPDRMQPCELFPAMVAAGHLGQKKDGGLYDRSGQKPGPGRRVLAKLRGPNAEARATRSEVVQRLIYGMVDEAYRCLDEGLVESTDDLDLGLVMGIGFPPFTGGITRYAEREGLAAIVRGLEQLATVHGPRFTPSAALRERM